MKVIKEDVLSEDLVVLTEASLNRLVRGHDEDGYAVLSASRFNYDVAENNKRFNSLKKDVKSLGYSYVPVFGGYIETGEEGQKEPVYEKSLYVLPFKRDAHGEDVVKDFESFKNDMINLGKKYEQEAILITEPNEPPAYYYMRNGKYGEVFNGVTSFNDIKNQYFTSLKKWNGLNKRGGSPQRFTFSESYLMKQPDTISGAHARSLSGELIYLNKKS